jgi:type IV pilus assembly protein PilX
MIVHTRHQPLAQRGVVLVSAMLLLIVMTILALYMFRSNGVQELIAGNIREKQRANQTAEAAELYAEMWLSTTGNVLTNTANCASVGLVAWPSAPSICSFPLASVTGAAVTSVPWQVSGAEIGFTYFPGATTGAGTGGTNTGDLSVATAGGANNYYQVPRFYIGLLQSNGHQALYRIDAWNYAGTPNTVSVVESNYLVTCSVC